MVLNAMCMVYRYYEERKRRALSIRSASLRPPPDAIASVINLQRLARAARPRSRVSRLRSSARSWARARSGAGRPARRAHQTPKEASARPRLSLYKNVISEDPSGRVWSVNAMCQLDTSPGNWTSAEAAKVGAYLICELLRHYWVVRHKQGVAANLCQVGEGSVRDGHAVVRGGSSTESVISQEEAQTTYSSSITSERGEAVRIISLVSLISTMNVDLPRLISSLAPMRVCTASWMPNVTASAGTKLPIWAMHTMSA